MLTMQDDKSVGLKNMNSAIFERPKTVRFCLAHRYNIYIIGYSYDFFQNLISFKTTIFGLKKGYV
jgi:hypothetical protein